MTYLLEKDGLKPANFPDSVNSDFPSSPPKPQL